MTVNGADLVETRVDSPVTAIVGQSTNDSSPTIASEQSSTFLFQSRPMPSRSMSAYLEAGLSKEQAAPYPSPADSHLDENSLVNIRRASFAPVQQYGMLPPAQVSPRAPGGMASYYNQGYKRVKANSIDQPAYQHFADAVTGQQAPYSGVQSMQVASQPPNYSYSPPPCASGGRVPPSPVASSLATEDSMHSTTRVSQLSQPDRRMSIESLITGSRGHSTIDGGLSTGGHVLSQSGTPSSYYGLDCGYPDFDTPFNHDDEALNDVNPSVNACPKSLHRNGAGMKLHQSKHEIKVEISQEFEPLPDLLKKPINLLYFHHFIDRTAKILVPHDCAGNPFRKILPRSECLFGLMCS